MNEEELQRIERGDTSYEWIPALGILIVLVGLLVFVGVSVL